MNPDPNAFSNINYLDVETDENGEVVAVWFRRQSLPFKQIKVDKIRVDEMNRHYEEPIPPIKAIEVDEK